MARTTPTAPRPMERMVDPTLIPAAELVLSPLVLEGPVPVEVLVPVEMPEEGDVTPLLVGRAA